MFAVFIYLNLIALGRPASNATPEVSRSADVYAAEETSLTDIPSVLSHGGMSVVLAKELPGAGPLTRLPDDGLQQSPLLRPLVSRLAGADVMVRDAMTPRRESSARVTVVGRTAGVRDLLVGVGSVGDRHRQRVILGHELQHAVEIAGSPAIVDRMSMQHEYSRMDTSSVWVLTGSSGSRPMWHCRQAHRF